MLKLKHLTLEDFKVYLVFYFLNLRRNKKERKLVQIQIKNYVHEQILEIIF
jgi:hypothetical protein